MSRPLTPFVALAGVDLRGEPITGAQCRFDPGLHTGRTPRRRPRSARPASWSPSRCASPARCAARAWTWRCGSTEHGVWASFTAAGLATLADLAAPDSDPSVLDLNEVA
ncbi:hypothetical protein ACFQHO_35530 [Actinomadura yumaensis]|uniref:hypothetical protein n=1 Tax=Actinomadura yumaensis TaxID=111807 RepID=UPI00361CDC89